MKSVEPDVVIRALFLVSMAINIIAESVVGFYLLFTAYKKSELIQIFVHFNFVLALWAFGFFVSQLVSEYDSVLFWYKFSMIFVALFPALYLDYHAAFARTFTGLSYRVVRIFFYSFSAFFSGLFAIDAFIGSSFLISGVSQHFWFPYWPDLTNPLFSIFLAYFCVGLTTGSFLLWRARGQADKVGRTQINIIFSCSGLAAVAGTTQFLIWYQLPIPPLGGILIPAYVFGLLYAVVRFGLFNIKIIAAQLFTFSMWAILLLRIFASQDTYTRTLDISIFVLAILFGFVTIQSVLNEARQREQLKDLNDNLEKRVAEQTQEIRTAYEVEKKSRIELEKLDKAKDEFMLTTQHHLRTPLTIVKGFLQLLFEEKDLSKDGKEYLSKAFDAAERMGQLINEFLNASEIKVGKATMSFEPIVLYALIGEIQREITPQIKKKKLSFALRFSPEASLAKTNVDFRIIKTALYNLIDNAIAYTSAGGIEIRGEILNHPIDRTPFIRVKVMDTGIGLSKEEIDRIFVHAFERGVEAQKVNATGKGIGLVLSKNMIQAHGGKLFVQSDGKGKGSVFIIELPLAKGQ